MGTTAWGLGGVAPVTVTLQALSLAQHVTNSPDSVSAKLMYRWVPNTKHGVSVCPISKIPLCLELNPFVSFHKDILYFYDVSK